LEISSQTKTIKSKKPVTISRDWLTASKTSNARSKIKAYLNEKDKGLLQRIRELKLQDFNIPKFFRRQ
jgi:(p)ppGpp synthase/HD superfamily hydrolase